LPFDDFLADRQADAGSGIFGLGMKALKNHKNALGVLLRDADPVIHD